MTLKIESNRTRFSREMELPLSMRDDGPRMLTPSEIDWLRQNLKASYKELLRIAEERDRQANPA